MYLKQLSSGDLVEVLELQALFDPFETGVQGRIHAGEELQDPARFAKSELAFPSGEALPRCWMDPDYRAQRRTA
ncbi:MAG TPA: acetyltransferase [Gammaproteobacteria bacterium]